ncbi:MAG: trypsin-like peptidase domain-containing protein [Candidatus Omnitrophica bacterium]|nr:trypsin-like peptidase domain-containing protein [Candidatus Omnitrophota bacterium]
MQRIKIPLLTITILLLATLSYAEPPKEALCLQDAFSKVSEEVGPAVVNISIVQTERYQRVYYPFSQFEDEFFKDFFDDFFVDGPQREYKKVGVGSGVIIDKQGHILTNEHVIQNADKITVTLSDGREFEGLLTGSDVYSDLAIIEIDPKGEDLPFARLGDSDGVKIGQWAIAIGNPFAFAVKNPEPTLTVGVVSALNRSLPRTDKRVREYSDLIQTDASINPGNSGGPLLNIYGEIIGINVAIFTLSGGSEGIGFAIPINAAKKIMKDLIEGRQVLHGWLGVVIQDVDADIAGYFGFRDNQGVLVSMVVEGSPAEYAGLRSKDVIISFENENIRNTQDLIRRVLKKEVGDKATLGVIRGGRQYSVDVEIGARPGEQPQEAFEKKEDIKSAEVKDIKYWRGLEASDITSEMALRYKLEVDSGVIVINVEPASPAENAGIRRGDIIYEINRAPINSMRDYINIVSRVSGDALVGTYRGYVVVKE